MLQLRCRGFTLVELLIVIAIICILATITATHLIRAANKAKRAQARAFIGKLELAISMYKMDTGKYPPHQEGSASLRQALDPTGSELKTSKIPGWKGPYLEFADNEVNSSGQLVDPWYNQADDAPHIYIYRANLDNDPSTAPPFHNTASFDIYCTGFDGKTGSDDKPANEFADGNYCQNGEDDDGDKVKDELTSDEDKNGYLEDDINNW